MVSRQGLEPRTRRLRVWLWPISAPVVADSPPPTTAKNSKVVAGLSRVSSLPHLVVRLWEMWVKVGSRCTQKCTLGRRTYAYPFAASHLLDLPPFSQGAANQPQLWLAVLRLAVAWGVGAPVKVSPGQAVKLALSGDACPTFNWGAVPGTRP